MDFGSAFVFDYDNSEDEDIDYDCYDDTLHVSGSSGSSDEEEAAAAIKIGAAAAEAHRKAPAKKRRARRTVATDSTSMRGEVRSERFAVAPTAPPRVKRTRRADTNVIVVRFDTLSKPSAMHAGDPTYCGKCGVILTKISPITTRGEDKIWTCEFCNVDNVVDVEPAEIPQKEDVTFMLEPAAATSAAGKSGADDILVVFCVDVSGSMCVTTELPGTHNLRGSSRARQLNHRFNERREPQYLPSEKRNVTYVTRLQALQAAVDHQIKQMASEFPERRPVLVAFNNEVALIGDGTKDPVIIAGDKLKDKQTLLDLGSEQLLPANVRQTQGRLSDKIFELEEGGGTCLGPALMISLAIAGQRPGSKVILCTDGKANVGLGSLETSNDEKLLRASEFYNDVSETALERSVSVSVITIKGTDCKLVELAKVAATTGGHVDTVDTMKLTSEFANILAENVIATNVKATLFLHSRLYFREESDKQSKIDRDIGNVTKSTEITFEYGVRLSKAQVSETALAKPLHTVLEESSTETALLSATPNPTDSSKTKESSGTEVLETDTKAEPEQSDVATNVTESANKSEAGEKAESVDHTIAPISTTDVRLSEAEPSANAVDSQAPGAVASTSDDTLSGATAAPSKGKADLKDVPFQIHICYTDTDGARAMRVITQKRPVTRDRGRAERALNMDVLGINMLQQTSSDALEGRYMAARSKLISAQRMMSSHTHEDASSRPTYERLFNKCKKFDSKLHQQMMTEREKTGTYSDDEMDCNFELARGPQMVPRPKMAPSASAAPKKKKPALGNKLFSLFSRRATSNPTKGAVRLKAVDDSSSAMMYQMVTKPRTWLEQDSSDDESDKK